MLFPYLLAALRYSSKHVPKTAFNSGVSQIPCFLKTIEILIITIRGSYARYITAIYNTVTSPYDTTVIHNTTLLYHCLPGRGYVHPHCHSPRPQSCVPPAPVLELAHSYPLHCLRMGNNNSLLNYWSNISIPQIDSPCPSLP